MSSTITVPSTLSSEVAAGLAGRGDPDEQNKITLAGVAQAAKTDIEALQASVAAVQAAAVATKRTVTIGYAAFSGLAGGVKTYDVNVGAVLPTGAVLLAPPVLSGLTGFDDAAHGTYVAVVGTSVGGNEIGTSESVAEGATGFPKQMTAGAQGYAAALQSGSQVKARVTSSVDLNTATAGAVTITFYFFVPLA